MASKKNNTEEAKTDLKHDSMEFTPPVSGEDKTDFDDPTYEEEDISADELDTLEDDPDSEAAALEAVETDYEADEDNLPEEDWTEDVKDEEDGEKESNYQRDK